MRLRFVLVVGLDLGIGVSDSPDSRPSESECEVFVMVWALCMITLYALLTVGCVASFVML
jgi:hypothetical protein